MGQGRTFAGGVKGACIPGPQTHTTSPCPGRMWMLLLGLGGGTLRPTCAFLPSLPRPLCPVPPAQRDRTSASAGQSVGMEGLWGGGRDHWRHQGKGRLVTGMTGWCSPKCQSCAGHRPPDVCWAWSPQHLGTWLLGWAGSAEEPGETGRESERASTRACVVCVDSEAWLARCSGCRPLGLSGQETDTGCEDPVQVDRGDPSWRRPQCSRGEFRAGDSSVGTPPALLLHHGPPWAIAPSSAPLVSCLPPPSGPDPHFWVSQPRTSKS